jgi:hypothetical protein
MRMAVQYLPLMMIFAGCSKNYICKCSGDNGVVQTVNISDTRRAAQGKCAQYGEQYGTERAGGVYCRIE